MSKSLHCSNPLYKSYPSGARPLPCSTSSPVKHITGTLNISVNLAATIPITPVAQSLL